MFRYIQIYVLLFKGLGVSVAQGVVPGVCTHIIYGQVQYSAAFKTSATTMLEHYSVQPACCKL